MTNLNIQINYDAADDVYVGRNTTVADLLEHLEEVRDLVDAASTGDTQAADMAVELLNELLQENE